MSEKEVKYRKLPGTGLHSFRHSGQRYSLKPGDGVTLPATFSFGSFGNQYEIVFGEPRKKRQRRGQEKQKTLEIVKAGPGFNVINPDNPYKPLNMNPISKDEALYLANTGSFKAPEVSDEDIKTMNWDQLVAVMERRNIAVLDEYKTESQLRDVLKKVK